MAVNSELLKNFVGLRLAIDRKFITPLTAGFVEKKEFQEEELWKFLYIFLLDKTQVGLDVEKVSEDQFNFSTWQEWRDGFAGLAPEATHALSQKAKDRLSEMADIYFASQAIANKKIPEFLRDQPDFHEIIMSEEQWKKVIPSSLTDRMKITRFFKEHLPYGSARTIVQLAEKINLRNKH